MLNNLFIKLIRKEYPYPEDLKGKATESWAEIAIVVQIDSDELLLLNLQWNALPLIEWFVTNQEYIASEEFHVLGEKIAINEGLAQALYRIKLEKFLNPPNDQKIFGEWTKEYDDYNRRHSLLTAMRGSRMKNILLGCNHGKGEVSFQSETTNWKYEIDMKGFIKSFQNEAQIFLATWKQQVDTHYANKNVPDILKELQIEVNSSCSTV